MSIPKLRWPLKGNARQAAYKEVLQEQMETARNALFSLDTTTAERAREGHHLPTRSALVVLIAVAGAIVAFVLWTRGATRRESSRLRRYKHAMQGARHAD